MSRLTAKELDAVLTALGFLLAGDTDGFEPGIVEAAESAHDKLSKRIEKRNENASAVQVRRAPAST